MGDVAKLDDIASAVSHDLPYLFFGWIISMSLHQSNQIFHYTSCITRKRVTSLRGPSLRYCACGQRSVFRRNVAAVASRWQFEPETSCSSEECVTARPTGRYTCKTILFKVYFLENFATIGVISCVARANLNRSLT